jgi:hypothetical protein
MYKYTKSQVEAIQKAYRYLFPTISPELERFWYPADDYDWLCMTSRFNESGPTFENFQALDNDLASIDLNRDPDIIGSELAQAARKHRVGFSIGLNPWADYLLLQAQHATPQEVVVIIAYNWYPLVTISKNTSKPPNSPLYQDCPFTWANGKYAFVFEPFKDHKRPLLMLFTNIFPHFMEAGEPANAGLSADQNRFVGGKPGMKDGLIHTLNAINPSIQIRGLVFLGNNALSVFCDIGISAAVKGFREESIQSASDFPALSLGDKKIPYLPFFHPAARELIPTDARKEYQCLYKRLAEALVRIE